MPDWLEWIEPVTPYTVGVLALAVLVPVVIIEGLVRWWRRDRK